MIMHDHIILTLHLAFISTFYYVLTYRLTSLTRWRAPATVTG
jgi:hypothetical protein